MTGRPCTVGLTGGLASGKSTVAEILESLGAEVFDCDRYVHELYRPGGAGAKDVAYLFGGSVLDGDGGVDRDALAAAVLGDRGKRMRLEGAIHPLVRDGVQRWLETLGPRSCAVIEAALLVETGSWRSYDLLAVVSGMVDGVRHVHERPLARRALGVVVLHRFAFGALLVDVLLLVRNTLNPPSEAQAALADFSLAAGGASFGALMAALVTPKLAGRLGVTRWAGLTVLVAAAAAPAAISSQALWLLVTGSFAMGFSGQAVKIAGDTVLQREIEDDYRGRVFALYDVVLNVALVGGIFLTAFAVPASGVSVPLWVGIGLLLVATSAWSLRPVPAAR